MWWLCLFLSEFAFAFVAEVMHVVNESAGFFEWDDYATASGADPDRWAWG